MKIRNSVGCSIEGITEEEFKKFQKVGWITEEEYLKLNPEESR
jgi:hypothetical protein